MSRRIVAVNVEEVEKDGFDLLDVECFFVFPHDASAVPPKGR